MYLGRGVPTISGLSNHQYYFGVPHYTYIIPILTIKALYEAHTCGIDTWQLTARGIAMNRKLKA